MHQLGLEALFAERPKRLDELALTFRQAEVHDGILSPIYRQDAFVRPRFKDAFWLKRPIFSKKYSGHLPRRYPQFSEFNHVKRQNAS